MRPNRYALPDQLVEITTRTHNAQHLARPDAATTKIILGCIGQAQKMHPVKIHAFVYMSNHFHMLVSVRNAKRLSEFMCHLNGNTSRELNRLRRRTGALWHRRFTSVPVTLEAKAQKARLRYILKHGVKERLVRRVSDWPGASSVPWLLHARQITGVWIDRTRMYDAKRRKGFVAKPGDFEVKHVIQMEPLPCWADDALGEWREEVRSWVEEIESELSRSLELESRITGRRVDVSGVSRVLAADPFARPETPARSHAPAVHAATLAEANLWRSLFKEMRTAYDDASRDYRSGHPDAVFPEGVLRPMGPFVEWSCQVQSAEAA
jgi:putative transposase